MYASFYNATNDEDGRVDAIKKNLDKSTLSKIDVISCSTFIKSSLNATVYSIDLYSPSFHLDSVRKHLQYHLASLPEVTPTNGFLMVSFHDDRLEDDVTAILSDCGVREELEGAETHKVWWEMNVTHKIQ